MKISKEISLWINWAIYAIYGKQATADSMMQQFRSRIQAGAREMMAFCPVEPVEIYRGIVLNDKLIKEGKLPAMDAITYMSFSENLQVACYFGNPHSEISTDLLARDPTAKGYIATRLPRREEILFHYSWQTEIPFERAAQMHPDVEDPRQFIWNLRTQSEVIIKPLPHLAVKPIEECDCNPVEELDESFFLHI